MNYFFDARKVRGVVISVFLLALLPRLVFAEGEGKKISIIDYYGTSLVLDGPAESVVSLSPGITETVFALGYGHLLLGRSAYCDYPPEIADIAVVGNMIEPNIEHIVSLSPDIVIASTHFTQEAFEKLMGVGLKVAVLMGQETFEGVYDGVIRPVAVLLGDAPAGERLISSMKATVAETMKRVERFTARPTVYYVVGFGEGGDWTAGGDTFIGEMIEMAGGENIAADVHGWSFNLESLVERDPDIILIPPWAEGVFSIMPLYSDLRAVRSGNVIVVDDSSISRQGPRIAEAFADLVDTIGAFH